MKYNLINTKYIIFLVVIIFHSNLLFCQKNTNLELNEIKITINNQSSQIEKLELNQKNLQEINDLKLHHLESKMENKITLIDSKYNSYIVFASIIIAIFAFLINYFGRKYIKTKVELLIEKTAVKYAENKTDQVLNIILLMVQWIK